MLMQEQMDTAVSIVASRFRITEDELLCVARSPRHVAARRTVFVALSMLDWSLAEISRSFGRNHSTVRAALAKADDLEAAFARRVVAFINASEEEVERRGMDA